MAGRRPGELRARLFDDVRYADDLDDDERARYQTANHEARQYASTLERRYLRDREVPDMLVELRRFYRLPLEEKLGHIARACVLKRGATPGPFHPPACSSRWRR